MLDLFPEKVKGVSVSKFLEIDVANILPCKKSISWFKFRMVWSLSLISLRKPMEVLMCAENASFCS